MSDANTRVSATLGAFVEVQRVAIRRGWAPTRAGDAAALRRVRIASRRLRELVGLIGAIDAVPSARAVERAGRAFRRITRAFGPVREMDVSVAELGAVTRRHRLDPVAVARVRERLIATQSRRRARLERWMARADRDDLDRRARALAEVLDRIEDHRSQRALRGRILHRQRRTLAAAAACGTLYEPERLHRFRIALKKLRYTLELAVAAGHTAWADGVDDLVRVQRQFGTLHDRQVLQAEVARAASSRRPGVRLAAALVVDALERDCRSLHAGIVAGLPDLQRRLGEIRQMALADAAHPRPAVARVTAPAPARRRRAGGH